MKMVGGEERRREWENKHWLNVVERGFFIAFTTCNGLKTAYRVCHIIIIFSRHFSAC